jgi:S1-C subfamily serine protease
MMMAHERGAWYVVITAVVLQSGIAAGSLQAADDRKPSPDRPKVRLQVDDAPRLEVRAYGGTVTASEFNFHRQATAPMEPDGELRRRAMFGAQLAPVTKEVRDRQKLDGDGGVVLEKVFPGTAAADGDFKAGDVILGVATGPS